MTAVLKANAAQPRPSRRILRPVAPALRLPKLGIGWIVPVGILVLWDVSVRIGLLDPVFFASPETVAAAGLERLRSGRL